MLSDFRFALRTLVKSPGFTLVAVFTLALAIGVNSAIFALVHGAILRPVIPKAPDEVVNVFTARKAAHKDFRQFSYAEFEVLRAAKDIFADVGAMNPILVGIGQDESVRRSFAFMVSDNYFSMLGTTPAAGRFFTAAETKPNANLPVVVASYELWQRYGGRSDFVGSILRINGQPHTVIGVTRHNFSGLNALLAPDVWLPLGQFTAYAQSFSDSHAALDLSNPKNYSLNITARMAPGLTLASLPGRLPALAKALAAVQPADDSVERELVVERPSRFSISTSPTGDSSPFPLAATLLGMSGCVLLIACLNLANMLLARGHARSREIAVRLALGATRGRIVRQLVVEGFVLAVLGGAAGLLFALWSNDLLLHSLEALFSTMNFSLAIDASPSLPVLGTTLLFATCATLLFSVGPALRASRTNLVPALKQGSESNESGRFSRFFAGRHLLVMAQIALSFMLLFSAGLFVRGALAAGGAKLGFEPQGQVIVEVDYSLGSLPAVEAQRQMLATLDRVGTLPGVTRAAYSTQLPYGNVENNAGFADAREAPSAAQTDANSPKQGADAILTAVTPGYFEAMGVPLLRGRDFTESEARDSKSPRVAILDETMARKLFPHTDAVGQHIRYTQPRTDGSPSELEVVGVCAPFRQDALHKNDRARVMLPFAQGFQASAFIHVRTSQPVEAAVPMLRQALRGIDPLMPVLGINPMADLVDRNIQLWIVRLGAALFGLFGGIALLLAVVGVYGVKTYLVSRRTREIGIRMAIGARPGDVFALIMKQGALQTALALAAGLLLALGAGQLLASFLYKVSPLDPLALGGAAAILASAALFACYLPARRATRITPMTALRSE